MKKILTLISMFIFVFSFTACGSNGEKAESEVLEAHNSSEAESSTTTKSSAESSTLAERLQEDTDESNNVGSDVTESTATSKKKSDQKKKTQKEASSQADTSRQPANNSSTKTTTKSVATKSTTKATTKSTTKAAAQSTTKSTTQSTTKPTTQSTTKSTTQSTTKATTKPTTKATTKPTTKATTQLTTKPTVAEEDKNMLKIEIVVGNKSFSATLYDNAAAKALLEMLPMTLNMSELNGNEKYYYLDNNLPTNSSRPSGIETGDIMLYGNNCLVLFYESFSTSYSYTPLGRIDDPKGLADALGSGNVQVIFRKG